MRWLYILVIACLLVPSAHVTAADDDSSWHTLFDAKGKIGTGNALEKTFSPRTARWRLTLSSESKTPANSSWQIAVSVEEIDARGHKAFHQIKGGVNGRGGDTKELSFDNGLAPDGSPRKFKLQISGAKISAEVIVEDQSDKPASTEKEEKK